MRLKIEDIAKLAGVSRSTVSRVINHRSDVNDETRKKVMQVIEEYNFTPNIAARTLVTQRTRVIGILVPALASAFRTPYLPALLDGISDMAHQRDYATLIWWGKVGEEEEERLSRRILQKNQLMEGLIVGFHTMDSTLLQRIMETKIPFIMVERPAICADEISYVTIANVDASREAVKHLIKVGYRRIGHITGPMNNVDGVDRLKGYREALAEHDLPFDPSLVVEGMFDYQSGYLAMQQLLQHGVDAVFAGNDETAYGALRALRDEGLSVPAQVAVVGFDDLPPQFDFKPELTTVHHPVQQKGATATALLLDIIEGKVQGPQHRILPTHLVIRESCGVRNQTQERTEVIGKSYPSLS